MPATILYSTGIHQEMIIFANTAEKDLWDTEVLAIKVESAAAFNKKEKEGITNSVHSIYNDWIAHVLSFKAQFGEDKTSQDSKWSLNTAKAGMGLAVLQWQNLPNATLFEWILEQ